jgi:hypothetical protein
MKVGSVEARPEWVCGWCGTPVGSEVALRDHQEWCLGDARLNERLIAEVVAQEGELTHEALVAAAEHFRLAQEGANPPG